LNPCIDAFSNVLHEVINAKSATEMIMYLLMLFIKLNLLSVIKSMQD
jgi:hypothetical protein